MTYWNTIGFLIAATPAVVAVALVVLAGVLPLTSRDRAVADLVKQLSKEQLDAIINRPGRF